MSGDDAGFDDGDLSEEPQDDGDDEGSFEATAPRGVRIVTLSRVPLDATRVQGHVQSFDYAAGQLLEAVDVVDFEYIGNPLMLARPDPTGRHVGVTITPLSDGGLSPFASIYDLGDAGSGTVRQRWAERDQYDLSHIWGDDGRALSLRRDADTAEPVLVDWGDGDKALSSVGPLGVDTNLVRVAPDGSAAAFVSGSEGQASVRLAAQLGVGDTQTVRAGGLGGTPTPFTVEFVPDGSALRWVTYDEQTITYVPIAAGGPGAAQIEPELEEFTQWVGGIVDAPTSDGLAYRVRTGAIGYDAAHERVEYVAIVNGVPQPPVEITKDAPRTTAAFSVDGTELMTINEGGLDSGIVVADLTTLRGVSVELQLRDVSGTLACPGLEGWLVAGEIDGGDALVWVFPDGDYYDYSVVRRGERVTLDQDGCIPQARTLTLVVDNVLYQVGGNGLVQIASNVEPHSVVVAPDGSGVAYRTTEGVVEFLDLASGKALELAAAERFVVMPLPVPTQAP